jgi:quercetin dioxygenase-like cupin family protein
MKRSGFIALISSTLLTLPFASRANWRRLLQAPAKAFKAQKGEGRKHGHLQLKGVNANVLDVKISGSDTNGGFAMFEQTSLSQGRGTPFHVHPQQDEVFYVLEGDYRFKVGEEIFNLSAGETIFLPRTVPHAWTQVSAKGRMTVLLQPAGKLENFFQTMAALNHEPSQQEVARIFEENEMKVVGPPLSI